MPAPQVGRAEVEQLLDGLLGCPWRSWDAALSSLLDCAVLTEGATSS